MGRMPIPGRTIGLAAITAAALATVAGGCGDTTDEAGQTDKPATAEAEAERATRSCGKSQVRKARSASYEAPGQTVEKGEALTAVVRTSCGTFSITLDAKRFPAAVNSFVFLATSGFYDGIPFDKAGAGAYLHGGDPPGKADGPGYTVPGQIPPRFIYRHGVVAMAEPDEAGYGRAGSQFFIVLAKPWLDFSGVYPPLGTIEKGFGVLEAISNLGPHARYPSNVGVPPPIGKLRRPVTIEKVSIAAANDKIVSRKR